jgi:hypothetical protein
MFICISASCEFRVLGSWTVSPLRSSAGADLSKMPDQVRKSTRKKAQKQESVDAPPAAREGAITKCFGMYPVLTARKNLAALASLSGGGTGTADVDHVADPAATAQSQLAVQRHRPLQRRARSPRAPAARGGTSPGVTGRKRSMYEPRNGRDRHASHPTT